MKTESREGAWEDIWANKREERVKSANMSQGPGVSKRDERQRKGKIWCDLRRAAHPESCGNAAPVFQKRVSPRLKTPQCSQWLAWKLLEAEVSPQDVTMHGSGRSTSLPSHTVGMQSGAQSRACVESGSSEGSQPP